MKCKDFEELLVQYLEDSLDPKERKKVEQHLGECEACRINLQEMESTLHLLAEEQLPQPEEDFWINFLPQVRSKIDAEEKPSFTLFPKPRLVSGVVSVMVIVLLGLFLFNVSQKRVGDPLTESSTESILSEVEYSSSAEQLAEVLSSEEDESLEVEVFLSSSEEEELALTESILEDDYLSGQSLNSILGELSVQELKQIEKSVKALQVSDIL
jgi:anti-sigma factor RsiW